MGNSAFHKAAYKGDIDAVNTLIANGANVNEKNDIGRTALHLDAALHGHVDTVNTLIANGANINEKDNDGKTAYDRAKTDEIKEILRNAMANVNTLNDDVNIDTNTNTNLNR